MKSYLRLWAVIALVSGPWSALGRAADPEIVPCQVIEQVRPFFPARALVNGVNHGQARLVLQVDPAGRLADVLVTAYSNQAFADEALSAVRKWKFSPSQVAGVPAFSTLNVAFEFRADGLASTSVGPPEDLNRDAGQYEYSAVPFRQLDRIPAPLHADAPPYPQAWADQGIKGRVVVQFYIDQDGRVRMPSVVSADRPQLGWAAVAAVQQWRFEPPLRNREPALTRTEQTLVFGPG